MKHLLILLAIISAPLLSLDVQAQNLDLHLSVNRKHIYLGESFHLTAKVVGSNKSLRLDLSGMKNCSTKDLGNYDISRSRVIMINTRVHRERFVGREYHYAITPLTAGSFDVGSVVLVDGQNTVARAGPTIDVTGIEKQELVDITVRSSRETVLVGEPFTITLSVALKTLGGRASHIDPINPRATPALDVPWLNMKPIPGLQSPEIRQTLQEILLQRPSAPGFHINDFTIEQRPSFFTVTGSEERARFSLPRTNTDRAGQRFFDYTLSLTYMPKEEGHYTFGPVIFKGDVLTAVTSAGTAVTEPVFAVGPAYTVRVIPPTEEGRPDSYIGAIGSDLAVTATLDAQTCNVGDPLSLTLSISGDVRFDNMFPPSLGTSEGVLDCFTVYEDSIKTLTENDVRKYIYTLRPTKAGTYELPPIDISFYDVNTRTYKTVSTQPVPIRARKTVELSPEDILTTATDKQDTIILSKQDNWAIAPITMVAAGAVPTPIVLERWHIAIIIIAPLICIITLLASLTIERTSRHRSARRQRHALKHALAVLRKARTSRDRSADLVVKAMRGYLADRFGVTGSSITPPDATRILSAQGIDRPLIDRFVEIMGRCFNLAYDSLERETLDIGNDCRSASEVISEIETAVAGKEGKA